MHVFANTPPEEARQPEYDLTESLIETAESIILILDFDGRIVRFNPYLEHISGYRLSEIQGQDWIDIFVPKAEREEIRARLQEVQKNTRLRGVNTLVMRDGQRREIAWSVKVLKGAAHTAPGILAVGQDVTDYHQAQTSLRSLIETTQDAVITIDRQGHIELFNPAAERIFGYTREEIVGHNVTKLMPDPYAREHHGYVEGYERTGERRAIGHIRTVAALRKNGQVFPIELSVTEIRTGNNVRYGAFIRDISEKVRLQEQLVERERLAAIGTTAATFAHEVGNPLNSMYMAAQLLERRLGKQREFMDETVITPLRNLTGEMKRLLALLEEFRSLARRQQLNVKPLALPALISDVCTTEAPYLATNDVEVARDMAPDLPPVEADAEKLKQVLLNLCKNAVEAMPRGGRLTVRAARSGERALITISDTGMGVPPGVDVFEPFVTTKTQGTGLGLTIVRQIVAAHKGFLTYHSAPGEGTTFTIDLPLKQPAR